MDNSIIEKIKSYYTKTTYSIKIFHKFSLYPIYFKDYQNYQNFVRELNKKVFETEDCFNIKNKLFGLTNISRSSFLNDSDYCLKIPDNYDILQFMFEYFNYISLN